MCPNVIIVLTISQFAIHFISVIKLLLSFCSLHHTSLWRSLWRSLVFFSESEMRPLPFHANNLVSNSANNVTKENCVWSVLLSASAIPTYFAQNMEKRQINLFDARSSCLNQWRVTERGIAWVMKMKCFTGYTSLSWVKILWDVTLSTWHHSFQLGQPDSYMLILEMHRYPDPESDIQVSGSIPSYPESVHCDVSVPRELYF